MNAQRQPGDETKAAESKTAPPPIKVPNPPENDPGKVQPETPKVGSRDAPGG